MSDIRVVAEIDSSGASAGAAEFNRATQTMRGGVSGLLGSLSGLRAALLSLGVLKLGQEMVQASDNFQNLVSRLNLVTGSAGQTQVTLQALTGAANRSRTPVNELIDLYTRNARSLEAMGISAGEAIRISETLGKVVQISGASGEQASAALMQLSQAFASGRFQGDEFRSVAENLPAVMQLLQRETGKTAGELRKLASDGKLTADVMASAFLNATNQVDADFARMTPTASNAFQLLENDISLVVGRIASSEGVTTAFVDVITQLRDVVASPEFASGAEALAIGVIDMARGFGEMISAARDAEIEVKGWYVALDQRGVIDSVNEGLREFRDIDAAVTEQVRAGTAALLDRIPALLDYLPVVWGVRQAAEALGVTLPSTDEIIKQFADSFRTLATDAHAAAEEIKAVGGLRGSTFADGADALNVAAPEAKRPVTFGAGAESAEEKKRERLIAQAKEQIDLLQLSNRLEEARLNGETTMVEALQNEIAMRRGVSSEIRAASPALANQLEHQILIEASLQRQKEQQDQLRAIGEEVGRTLTSGIMDSVRAGDDLDDTFRRVIESLIEMAAQTLILQPLIKDLGNQFAGLASGASSSGVGGDILSTILGAAGSFFAFADGGVVGSKTTLATPGGFAVAGEAGPEAIMPLRRGPDGSLGVSAAGGAPTGSGGAPSVNVVVNVAGDATDATVERFRIVARDELRRATPQIIENAHSAVRRSVVTDPNFLRRR